MTHRVCLFFPSCPCRGGDSRRGCPMFQADVQRGFLIRPILWREPTCQHHHGKGSLWGRDASSGFPDQAARGSDTPVTTWTLLCAQSTQLHHLWDQEQRRAHSEELYFGRWGNNMTLMLFCAVGNQLQYYTQHTLSATKLKNYNEIMMTQLQYCHINL